MSSSAAVQWSPGNGKILPEAVPSISPRGIPPASTCERANTAPTSPV
jgi:hypothetical protein